MTLNETNLNQFEIIRRPQNVNMQELLNVEDSSELLNILYDNYATALSFKIIGMDEQKLYMFSDLEIEAIMVEAKARLINYMCRFGEIKIEVSNHDQELLVMVHFPLPIPIYKLRNLVQFAERATKKIQDNTNLMIERLYITDSSADSYNLDIYREYIFPTNFVLDILGVEQSFLPVANIASNNIVTFLLNNNSEALDRAVNKLLGEQYKLAVSSNIQSDIRNSEFNSEFEFSKFDVLVRKNSSDTESAIVSILAQSFGVLHSRTVGDVLCITCDYLGTSYFAETIADFEDALSSLKCEFKRLPPQLNIIKIQIYMEACLYPGPPFAWLL
ncbi:hypothetical protein [Paenibacillus sp. OK003]|uniref:hypothetical protein n=1 Tax=Paenibacillus sp. OK003 TaxID=1884380 RepID=UPI0008C1CD2B|nr:hypothetical protein [Paenibacillus sp. OK003]SEL78658.1 hypothetical protein SAMN05518856_11871 [Paenibacillus sp. OK003]